MTDRVDFLIWIQMNRVHFREDHYTTEEIALLAKACGFTREAIDDWKILKMRREAAKK